MCSFGHVCVIQSTAIMDEGENKSFSKNDDKI